MRAGNIIETHEPREISKSHELLRNRQEVSLPMMRVLKPLQDKATTGAGKKLVLPEPRGVRFLIRGEGPVSAGAVTIECCPESTKAGKFWMELATIPVPADNGLAQYYTEEASGLLRARISRPVSNGTVTVTPLVSRGGPDRPDRTKVV